MDARMCVLPDLRTNSRPLYSDFAVSVRQKNDISLARNIACFTMNMVAAHWHFLDLSSQTSVFRQMVLSSPENVFLPRHSFAGSGLIRNYTERMQIMAIIVEN